VTALQGRASAPVDEAGRLLASVPTDLCIGGTWRPAGDGRSFAVEDPATGATLATVADAGPAEAVAALDAAAATQPAWAAVSPRDRSDLLRAAFDAVRERAEDFAQLISLEMGKPLAEARGEVAYAADFLRWFSEEAPRAYGRYSLAPDGRSRLLVSKHPVGPCLLVTPWNFPLAMATRKIGPALAAGCTTILKPAELTPLTSALFTALLHDVGVPAGVVNLVQTTRPGDVVGPLLQDSRLRKLSFTGSTPVGRRLLRDCADGVIRTSMELGGNAPFIVFEDADVDAAVEGALRAKLRNAGEACTAANRFLVAAPVADRFAQALRERFADLVVGAGQQEGTDIGPLIDGRSRDKVHRLVTEAVAEGAAVVTGGATVPGPGYFYPPTVLTQVPSTAAILKEEIFGPVAPIVAFHDEDQAVALANATQYGLAAYVYTRDLDRGLRMSDRLDVGMVGLNTGVISNAAAPFGGVKQSGTGREGGPEGLDEYMETRYTAISTTSGA
jgi:succinate-semialdehyde dehydrogenase/glutarate-semialdehyde dehydrogenase